MIKNNKGITLVEVIAAVAIFSIVAIMIVIGFTTASNIILRSNQISNSSNVLSAELESDSLNQAESETTTISVLGKTVRGNLIEKNDTNVSYKAFVPLP